MKRLTTIALLVALVFTGCMKDDLQKKDPVIEYDGFNHQYNQVARQSTLELVTASNKGGSKRPPRGPVDTPVVVTGTAVLLLVFDGETVQNTMWNTNGPIVATYSGLQTFEIDTIVNRITNAFAPYKITVTTSRTVYNATPLNKRQRIIFTEYNEWYGSGAGGVAYIGSYDWADDTPCWAFTKLMNYNEKQLGDVGVHEAGHTFSLRHQAEWQNGVLINKYRYGPYWMGVPYYVPWGEWIVGIDPWGGVQDDNAILTSKLGRR